jgi:catechol 2,3-dioxygenase-like lactoylglutathione lyase family enzyme
MPAIIAPVSRSLAVIDVAKSIEFYRDILGFAVRSVVDSKGVPIRAQLVRGPAAIDLVKRDHSTASAPGPVTPRPAIVFFQTSNVAAFRDTSVARGAKPSELENASGIKMRMFEIRDPDGHTLWFGQSYDEPTLEPARECQLEKGIPELPLDDVPKGVAYYRDVLGFHVNYAQHDIGVMDRDEVRVLLIKRTSLHAGIGSFYAYVHDADALHAELLAKGARVQGEPVSQPWGLREFQVLDLAGNRITFGQPFE